MEALPYEDDTFDLVTSKPGVLEDLATEAGLTPESAFDATWAYAFPDQDTGSYRLDNQFHYLLARA
jgi:hypothetical protein